MTLVRVRSLSASANSFVHQTGLRGRSGCPVAGFGGGSADPDEQWVFPVRSRRPGSAGGSSRSLVGSPQIGHQRSSLSMSHPEKGTTMTQLEELAALADDWASEGQEPQSMSNECHGGGGATQGKALGCDDLAEADGSQE